MRAFETTVTIPQETRQELVDLLNQLLANTSDLYTQAKHAHWNVKGKHFFSRHELFDRVADHARKHADLLAERIATLGGYAKGTLRMAASSTQLDEFDEEALTGEACVRSLVARISQCSGACREVMKRCDALDELITQDVLIEIVRDQEMDGWFLVNHLERVPTEAAGAEPPERRPRERPAPPPPRA